MTSIVIPLHKGGDRGNCGNHRPVNLVSIMLKSLERALRDGIVNHIEANNLVIVEQHGFWHKCLCLTKLMSFLNKVTGRIDRGERVEA